MTRSFDDLVDWDHLLMEDAVARALPFHQFKAKSSKPPSTATAIGVLFDENMMGLAH